MFERYTEKARRTIFFARYEASQFASGQIETEHLLLGLLREDKTLFKYFSRATNSESVRNELFPNPQVNQPIPTSVDLKLSKTSKQVLKYAADEADQLKHRHIGTEHLLLGLLREDNSPAAKVLRKYGAELSSIRKKLELLPEEGATVTYAEVASRIRYATADTVEIHGSRFNTEYIHEAVKTMPTVQLALA
ncbi:MAG: hypothetical protein DMG89_05535 [Acidobacteria bacterium]|nr:MAG: hypothetical protein DMG89_05535 [Acidobacteriota bacterium]